MGASLAALRVPIHQSRCKKYRGDLPGNPLLNGMFAQGRIGRGRGWGPAGNKAHCRHGHSSEPLFMSVGTFTPRRARVPHGEMHFKPDPAPCTLCIGFPGIPACQDCSPMQLLTTTPYPKVSLLGALLSPSCLSSSHLLCEQGSSVRASESGETAAQDRARVGTGF